MSRSGFSRSAASDATRQKLDELDALIQQMLNLPGGAEDRGQKTEDRGQKSEVRSQRSEVRSQKSEDGSSGREEQRTEDKEQTADTDAAGPATEAESSGPAAEEDRQLPAATPSSDLRPLTSDLRPLTSDLCSSPQAPRWWLYPVLGLNLLFDGLTFLLGPVGRWLRGETGRLLLGWLGVGLFLAGLAWAFLGWMGWIK